MISKHALLPPPESAVEPTLPANVVTLARGWSQEVEMNAEPGFASPGTYCRLGSVR